MLRALIALLGLIAAIYGICSAVLEANPHWYSYFTIGSYVFLGSINRAVHGNSTLPGRDRTSWGYFFELYFSYLLVGSIIDILYGRFVGDVWVYPHHSLAEEVLHVVIIGYPCAFLSVIETYSLIHFSLARFLPALPSKATEDGPKSLFRLLVAVAGVSLLAHLILKPFARAEVIQQVLFLSMIGTIFFFDALNGLSGKRSLLLQALCGRWVVTFAIVFTNIIAPIMHEVPNTYAHEWVYRDVPFTDIEVWGVNILIVTFGWLFLVVIPLSIHEMIGDTNPK